MEKYLFTDGTNVVREVQSRAELQELIQAAGDPGKLRIWLFNTSEWISYAELSKLSPAKTPLSNPTSISDDRPPVAPAKSRKKRTLSAGFAKFFIVFATAAAIFLVYNFSRERWYTASSLSITAARPLNTPVMDIDSLIRIIESSRKQKLDKVTLTNLRIRNSWPDRIELKLTTDRDTGRAGSRFYNIELAIDNSTGYMIDEAIVELRDWRNGSLNATDSFHFQNIGYSSVLRRVLDREYISDSLSVSFLSLKAKAFNFCYAWDKESNYGNLNDRWFCRE